MNKYQELINELSVKVNKGLNVELVNKINLTIKRLEDKYNES